MEKPPAELVRLSESLNIIKSLLNSFKELPIMNTFLDLAVFTCLSIGPAGMLIAYMWRKQ